MKDNVMLKVNSATAEDWRKAVEKVFPVVVELHMTACRAFDTEYAGPVVAKAVFVNRKEIPVYPLYRDPVHDFGLFRFDPAAIKYLSYEEIPLAPKADSAGLEIRVIGNDSGEKAASDTKGGSSGSPVIDCQGRAVALNADSMTSSASAFYFPFERVARALKFLQNGVDCCQNKWEAVTIPSGTLQLVRNACPPSETGMLVVNSVVAPAYKSLVPGDVLVRMNGEVITHFLKMETLLDDGVGQNVELEFERNGKPLTVQLVVQDLHSIIPNSFLEVSGAVIHPLSYQQILINDLSCLDAKFLDAIFLTLLAEVPRHAIIKKLAGEDISNLEDFINALSMLSRGARVPLEYITYEDRQAEGPLLLEYHLVIRGLKGISEYVGTTKYDEKPGPVIVTQHQNSRNALLAESVIEPTIVMLKNCSCERHQIAKGIPIHSLNQVLKEIISGANGPSLVINGVRRPMPLLRILEVELYPTLLFEARSFRLSNNWIQALVEKDPVRCQVLQVQGYLAGSKAKNLLQQFDMVLETLLLDVKLSFLWEQIQDTALVLHAQSIGAGVLYNILIQQYVPLDFYPKKAMV
ncbi:protease Do-like protein 7 [Tanacetum coccineum]